MPPLFDARIKEIDSILAGSNTIYASGDALGTIVKLSDVVPHNGGNSKITKVVVTDASVQSCKLVLFFYRDIVPGGTDNAAYAPNAAARLLSIGHIVVNTTDYAALSGSSEATVTIPEGFPIKVLTKRDVYMQVVAYGTPTYAAGATDVHVRLDFSMQS